jgi:hypothetical protein
VSLVVCARHGTERARCQSSCQVFAEPKARSGARASTVRWGLEEAHSTRAGRRPGTGEEVWYTRDERARAREVLHPHRGVLYQSGVYTRHGRCLTLGDLHGVHVAGMDDIAWPRQETRRQQRKPTSSCSPDTDEEGRDLP